MSRLSGRLPLQYEDLFQQYRLGLEVRLLIHRVDNRVFRLVLLHLAICLRMRRLFHMRLEHRSIRLLLSLQL